jgi:predicted DNA-binding protein (UPF0251 family)
MPITQEQEDALRLIESGMSQRQAAEALGISRAGLRDRLDRAKRNIDPAIRGQHDCGWHWLGACAGVG